MSNITPINNSALTECMNANPTFANLVNRFIMHARKIEIIENQYGCACELANVIQKIENRMKAQNLSLSCCLSFVDSEEQMSLKKCYTDIARWAADPQSSLLSEPHRNDPALERLIEQVLSDRYQKDVMDNRLLEKLEYFVIREMVLVNLQRAHANGSPDQTFQEMMGSWPLAVSQIVFKQMTKIFKMQIESSSQIVNALSWNQERFFQVIEKHIIESLTKPS